MSSPSNESLNKVDGLNHDFKTKYQDANIGFEKIAHTAGKKTGEMFSEASRSATDYVQTSREYVSQNPVKSVAISVVAGAVAGSLITLLMRRSN